MILKTKEKEFSFFLAFLETRSNCDKFLITCNFNFPDLTLNPSLVEDGTQQNIFVGSLEFRELTFDFFLCQVYPIRINRILDFVLSTTPEDIINLSCIKPSTMNFSSDQSTAL